MARDRFVNTAFSGLQQASHSLIDGYQNLSVLTLEEAIEKIILLVPNAMEHVANAKEKCNQNSGLLTWNESAAIYLYTMQTPILSYLNSTLRAKNRHALEPWFAFLKLFITALEKLPSTKATVWRGVNYDDTLTFVDNDRQIWWGINACSMELQSVQPFIGESGTLFAIDTIRGKNISAFSAMPDEKEVVLMPGTRVRRKCESFNFIDRLFVLYLEEENLESLLQTEPIYRFEQIKQEYQQHSRIERIMNPSKSFPIEKSYINLAIVETKEQQEKEKKLHNAKRSNEIISTYEEIYGTKTEIEIKDIFEKCKDQTKNIFVVGRAGIGKTTFCRYVAYQWASGKIWSQYQLVVLIQLRLLTISRYPPGHIYSPFDLVKKEYFPCDDLSEDHRRHFKEQCDKGQVLWILDGYDEIPQNIPEQLKGVFEHVRKTQHHILTSRPYLNTLSYNVQLEVTGFTDENIKKYVEQFFDQIKNKIDNASIQVQKLLSFLECNPRIWGIAHIPVNLEVICSLWCDTDWSETTTLSMTAVYDKMTEWLCRRHLEKQHISSSQMTTEDVYAHFHMELVFLESLAFNGMESKSIILPPKLLRKAFKESECSLQHHAHLLNIGILKSLDYKPIGTRIEVDKNHYFLHLSFQEHFAARYLVKALNGGADQKKKAIDFIKTNKYNQRFELVFTFASGLLTDCYDEQYINLFWETLLGEPLDLIGLRHVQIVISCLDEAGCSTSIPQYCESMNSIIKWINNYVFEKCVNYDYPLLVSLRRSPSVVNQAKILDTLAKLHKDKDPRIKEKASWLISSLPISNPYLDLIYLHLTALNDEDAKVRISACEALGQMGKKAATHEVIDRLMILLGDTNYYFRRSACEALGKMGEKVATDNVINRLMILLGDRNYYVRSSACLALKKVDEKLATNEVIDRLMILLGDTDKNIKSGACEALEQMGEKAATDEVINRLMVLLGDTDYYVRSSACSALEQMGEKVATDEVITRLMVLLGDTNGCVRSSACSALKKVDEKLATNEVINRLLILLGDTDENVRSGAREALEQMGEKAATNEVINRLLILLGDTNDRVRSGACSALGKMGEKAATNEVIDRLKILLDDTDYCVRSCARSALAKMGEKVATNEVINRVLILLDYANGCVRSSACLALEEMGEKAATNEVIDRLMILLGDTNDHVRSSACSALREMGEKAATNEVIDKLMILLDDTDESVRIRARSALGQMGEKVATNEVIHRFLILLSDRNDRVRSSALEALKKMGEKVATDEVISVLLEVCCENEYEMKYRVDVCIGQILELLPCMSDLKENTVQKLLKYISGSDCGFLRSISAEKFIRAFLNTKIFFWLPIIRRVFTMQGYAITVTGSIIVVQDTKESVELSFPNRELSEELQDYFVNC